MDTIQFWQLIEASQNKRRDCREQAVQLEHLLVELDSEEILRFDEVFSAFIRGASTPELWAISYIVSGGKQEHPFDHFRIWLISQDQTYFQKAVSDPDWLADEIDDGHCFCKKLEHVAKQAYKRKTGLDILEVLTERQSQSVAGYLERSTCLLGTLWKDEKELKARFPRLCEKFG